jgi:hypothetical protein
MKNSFLFSVFKNKMSNLELKIFLNNSNIVYNQREHKSSSRSSNTVAGAAVG